MIFDIFFLLVFIWAIYRGYTKGLIMQLATLAALFLGIFGAIKLADFTSAQLTQKFDISGQYLPIISFTLIFIIIVVLVHLIGFLVEKLAQATAMGIPNRIAGSFFAIVRYAFMISVLLVLVNKMHSKYAFMPEEKMKQSYLYKPLSKLAPAVFPYLRFEKASDKLKEATDKVLVNQ
ncbi:MAG: CvpA family protein [Bacteroidota bacterium]|nr:MAG: CvpA family protein [Bacteroidota bacterium]